MLVTTCNEQEEAEVYMWKKGGSLAAKQLLTWPVYSVEKYLDFFMDANEAYFGAFTSTQISCCCCYRPYGRWLQSTRKDGPQHK